MPKRKGSLPSPNLRRLLRQLRKNRSGWCPLGKSLAHPPGEKGVRAGYEHFFDLLSVGDDGVRLQWMFPVHETEYPDLDSFVGKARHGQVAVKTMPPRLRAQAAAVDDTFAELWSGVVSGRHGVRVYQSEQRYSLRANDGTYWAVGFEGDTPIAAERKDEAFLIWTMRSRVWERAELAVRPVDDQTRAQLAEALSLERVLSAPRVNLNLRTPTDSWSSYLLEGPDAYFFGDTGEEGPSADWTSSYPEAIYDWLPYERSAIEAKLRREGTELLLVDYAPKPR